MSETHRLLLVDDESEVLQSLRQILQAEYLLSFAKDGERAIELAREQPSLMLVDSHMPGIGGYETVRRLKADPATRAIPVLILADIAESLDLAEGLFVGAADFVEKPVQAPLLLARIKTHLSLARQGMAAQATAGPDPGLISRIGHDLRTPLNAVLGYAQLLSRESLDEVQQEYLQEIVQAGHKMINLIDALKGAERK